MVLRMVLRSLSRSHAPSRTSRAAQTLGLLGRMGSTCAPGCRPPARSGNLGQVDPCIPRHPRAMGEPESNRTPLRRAARRPLRDFGPSEGPRAPGLSSQPSPAAARWRRLGCGGKPEPSLRAFDGAGGRGAPASSELMSLVGSATDGDSLPTERLAFGHEDLLQIPVPGTTPAQFRFVGLDGGQHVPLWTRSPSFSNHCRSRPSVMASESLGMITCDGNFPLRCSAQC